MHGSTHPGHVPTADSPLRGSGLARGMGIAVVSMQNVLNALFMALGVIFSPLAANASTICATNRLAQGRGGVGAAEQCSGKRRLLRCELVEGTKPELGVGA